MTACLIALLLSPPGAPPPDAPLPDASTAVGRVLDDFHAAAAAADGPRYFGHFAPDGVFVGTDASEVWSVEDFKAYAQPHFAQGKGWRYVPRPGRRIRIRGDVAWFYEALESASYGAVRGSGTLVLRDGRWRIAQYVLSFAVPNAAAADVVERLRRP